MADTSRLLRHVTELGFKVNWEKSCLTPAQSVNFIGMHLESRTMWATLTKARWLAIQHALAKVRPGRRISYIRLLRLAGLLTAATTVIQFGLLYLRPFQRWLIELRLSAVHNRHTLVQMTRSCSLHLQRWKQEDFLRSGVQMGPPPARREVVTTDASLTGWGGVWQHQGVSGQWDPHMKRCHINVLELQAVFLTLKHFESVLRGKHVMVRTDNTSVVFHINHQGGTRSLPSLRLTQALLTWAETRFLSLRATHIPEGVRHTVLNVRAQSTRTMNENRWKLFTTWCTTHSLNPLECPVVTILDFLQHLLDNGRSPATLRVYVAALAAYRAPTEGVSLGAHKLVVAFMKGAQRLHPRPRTDCAPWDLHTVLNGLCSPPFEPLEQAVIKWLSIKTAFLLAITSTKRVSEVHALSFSTQCMRWGPEDSQVTLWPNPAFLPKVLSTQFANQPIVLAAFCPDGKSRSELCPVRALCQYVSQTALWRKTDQLFIRFGECGKGAPLSKQRLAHWVSEAITSAYRFADKTAPASARCHSTRAVASCIKRSFSC
ncbi:hypothetical protein ACEWY4_006180 [Coilia grayii]|uniref:Reverse transcriptase RNase H-like domain-containing protein n=1 Tax=Coilia grayii TaxID=363190 RepID=A0ABD1KCX7_9TELE